MADNKNTFEILLGDNYYKYGERIKCNEHDYVVGCDPVPVNGGWSYKCRLLNKPTRKWYSVLFEYITFRIYKAPYTYKLEFI